MNAPEAMLDLHAVARLLGIDERTVWRRVADETIPRPVKVGRAVRWFISDIQAFQQRLRETRAKHEN
jgi:predicted DNA-binding transcriptional regulator AlpA